MELNPANLALLEQGFSAAFRKGLGRISPSWSEVAMEIPSSTVENVYDWLNDSFSIREWIGDRVMQNVGTSDYRLKNKDFEGTVKVSKNRIEDDQYGSYSLLFEQMGDSTSLFPDKLVYSTLAAGLSTLCYDGQYFFDVDHPVGRQGAEVSVSNHMGGSGEAWFILDTSKVLKPLIYQPRSPFKMVRMDAEKDENVFMRKELVYGVDGRANAGYGLWQLAFVNRNALDATAIKATLTAMSAQKSANGEPLNVEGTTIVVSPNLAETANDIINSSTLANGASNTLKGRLKIVKSGWLL
jgi:phage major head subunit gpT-like protein